MKKLMIIATAFAIAVTANATSVDWSLVYAGKGADWSSNGATIMAFSGADYDDIVKLVTVTGSETLKNDLTSKELSTASFTKAKTSAKATGTVSKSLDSVFWMIFSDGSYDAGKAVTWTSAIDVSSYGYQPPATGTAFSMDSSKFVSSGTIAGSSSIPEPTSAMLLMLGLCGLALKRKNA